jgi:hypothetical protein
MSSTYNTCEQITILPLSLSCLSINPTTTTSLNGVLSLVIIGGTPPYTVVWTLQNGTQVTGQTIYNQGVGSYTCNVTDKYGDFSATTTCVLSVPSNCVFMAGATEYFPPAPTPSPTPTPTQTPFPTFAVSNPPTQTPTPTPTPTNSSLPTCFIPLMFDNPYNNCSDSNGYVKVNGVTVFSWSAGAASTTTTITAVIGDLIEIQATPNPPLTGPLCSGYVFTSTFVQVANSTPPINSLSWSNSGGSLDYFYLSDCATQIKITVGVS